MSTVEELEDERLLEACRVGDYNEVEKTIDQELIFSLFIVRMYVRENGFREQKNLVNGVCSFLEIKDEFGDTPLIVASSNGHTDIVRLLVFMGSNTERVNNEGSNCLIEASNSGNAETVSLLLKGNLVDPNVQDNEGYTALISATGYFEKKTISILLDYPETNPNLVDMDGNSALHYLCSKICENEQEKELSLDIIRLFYNKTTRIEIDFNIRNKQGITPFQEAVASENYLLVGFLSKIEKVDKYIECYHGDTLLEEAKKNNNTTMVEMLENLKI